ncbi:UPF0175 family protein [Halococcoides cellulosivorans]|uniref:Uncharacterized protein n=1 Tax=Halococcoides cellulosivorans TaxID=1679096 RepID=A0A2R4X024_9EURY|nr:UPF0175 family protein [Halococcoides cellulosivorans]AWB27137.1 hypothetical protein HARCEL1_05160 [Halococcoides cellulosivorans]
MIDVDDTIDGLREVGAYDTDAEVIEDAIRTLLRTKPELRTELAVEQYRSGGVSLNRAAETAGMSPTAFRELLADRGDRRPAGFLSESDRDDRLDDLE